MAGRFGFSRDVWVFGRVPATDEEAQRMLADPASEQDGRGDPAQPRLPLRMWRWLLHPGRLWLLLTGGVIALLVLGAMSSG